MSTESARMGLAEFAGSLGGFTDLLCSGLYGAQVELLEDYGPFKKGDSGVVKCTFASCYDFLREIPVRRGCYTWGVPYERVALRCTARSQRN